MNKDDTKPTPLSKRETQVLTLLCKDIGRKEIAVLLGTSPHTVTAHTKAIRHKLGTNTTLGAAVHAIKEGWV